MKTQNPWVIDLSGSRAVWDCPIALARALADLRRNLALCRSANWAKDLEEAIGLVESRIREVTP